MIQIFLLGLETSRSDNKTARRSLIQIFLLGLETQERNVSDEWTPIDSNIPFRSGNLFPPRRSCAGQEIQIFLSGLERTSVQSLRTVRFPIQIFLLGLERSDREALHAPGNRIQMFLSGLETRRSER